MLVSVVISSRQGPMFEIRERGGGKSMIQNVTSPFVNRQICVAR